MDGGQKKRRSANRLEFIRTALKLQAELGARLGLEVAAGICIFTSFAWGLADVAPQVAAACGPEFTLENLSKIGERIWNMERDFNNRAGFTNKDDNLPPRLLNEAVKTGPAKGLVSKLPEMLPKYYAARGWDADGQLKSDTRTRLGL